MPFYQMKRIAEKPPRGYGFIGQMGVKNLPEKISVVQIHVDNVPDYKGFYRASVTYDNGKGPLWFGKYSSPEVAFKNCRGFLRECYEIEYIVCEDVSESQSESDFKERMKDPEYNPPWDRKPIPEYVCSGGGDPSMPRLRPSMKDTRGMW